MTHQDLTPQISDRRIAGLYAYWRERCGERAMPARSDIDPLDFPYILGHMVVAEVYRDPLRFRYRLHGVYLVGRDGYDMTGRWLHDHPEPEYRGRIERTWTEAVRSGEPALTLREIIVDGRQRRYESLILPLGDDGHTVDKLIGAQIHID